MITCAKISCLLDAVVAEPVEPVVALIQAELVVAVVGDVVEVPQDAY